MESIEFEVKDALPPKYRSDQSVWVHEEEAQRLIKLRKEALKHFNRKGPFIMNIKLELEIWTPERPSHEKPGDLDNFIKGVCDSIYSPRSSLYNPNFPIYEDFELPENKDIHPRVFRIILDDEYIVEIKAKMNYVGKDEKSRYRIRIEGD